MQSVRDSCRRLRQEWEGMMQNAENVSTEMSSSFKAQEEALMAERAQVQSLKQETDALRRSFLQQTQEQETKALTEKALAEQISRNIHNQVVEVKQMQCQLADQLAILRSLMADMKAGKLDDNSAKPVSLATTKAELCSSMPHQSGELLVQERVPALEKDPEILMLSSGSSHILPNKSVLELDSVSSGFKKDTTESACTPVQIFEKSYGKVKTEVFSDDEYTEYNRYSGFRNEHVGSLQTTYHAPLGHKRCYDIPSRKAMVSNPVFVKTEPQEKYGCEQKLVNTESVMADREALEDEMDELDHVPLSQRLELLMQSKISKEQLTNEEYLGTSAESNVESLKRKKCWGLEKSSRSSRKWEVTIEIALQEDAPGLLEKLEEKGLVKDMVVYGSYCEDEWGNGDDHFKDLECIASKLWGTPTGFFKHPQVIRQHTTGLSKAPTYCLSCLVSLIDQTKSLRQRSWPVEWGWCRQLQAFIFVFDKHNRIVLERPEYGNATYFFELVQCLPVKWQVLRLIRVLSVTALGKTALLENRPLQVGYELTVDESKVLEGYGWTSNTGLGSFLNFCDRVVHDVKDDDNLEWRQRIGKCLMDGYDKGRITIQNVPPRLMEHPINAKHDEDT